MFLFFIKASTSGLCGKDLLCWYTKMVALRKEELIMFLNLVISVSTSVVVIIRFFIVCLLVCCLKTDQSVSGFFLYREMRVVESISRITGLCKEVRSFWEVHLDETVMFDRKMSMVEECFPVW